MTRVRQRLLAQLRTDEPVELTRSTPTCYITESAVRSLTENMNSDWRHWIETPMNDNEAIGRVIRHTPEENLPVVQAQETADEIQEAVQ